MHIGLPCPDDLAIFDLGQVTFWQAPSSQKGTGQAASCASPLAGQGVIGPKAAHIAKITIVIHYFI